MTSAQKVIKYAAMAFAIFLMVNIIGGILSAFGIITSFLGNDNVLKEMKNYEITDTVTELELDVKVAKLSIVTGEKLSVESNLKNLRVDVKNGKLVVEDKTHNWFGSSGRATLILSFPEELVLEKAEISTGAGTVNIEKLQSDRLVMKLGAGKVKLDNLNVKSRTKVDGGAGEITIKNSSLYGFDFDIGVGEVNCEAAILGESQIHTGVGATNITLKGAKEDYRICVDKGIGNVEVDGWSFSDGQKYGSGENEVEINVGVGAVRLDFE